MGLGQLLIEIDNRIINDGLVLLRATNRPEVLDSALIRPGRFHHSIFFSVPNKKKREAILKLSEKHFPDRYSFYNNKKKWDNLLVKLKGKSPAYLTSLRNLVSLYRRNSKDYISIEQRFDFVRKRIETTDENWGILKGIAGMQHERIYFPIKMQFFLEKEYSLLAFFLSIDRLKK